MDNPRNCLLKNKIVKKMVRFFHGICQQEATYQWFHAGHTVFPQLLP